MINLKTLLIILFSFSSILGFSQLKDFDLSSYKLPDLDRRSLEGNFNLRGNNSKSKYLKSAGSGLTDTVNEIVHYQRFTGNLTYSHYRNDIRQQMSSRFNFYLSYYLHNKKISEDKYFKDRSINPYVSYNRVERNYFKENTFWEIDINASSGLGVYSADIKDYSWVGTSESSSTTYNLKTYVPLKIGKGRIEEVRDARQAVYILDELRKGTRGLNDYSQEEIIEFSERISQIRNQRHLDSRLRRMAQIESLDSFLINKNYITKYDSRYFTILRDFWDYGYSPSRLSGQRVSFYIAPGGYHNYFKGKGDGNYYRNNDYQLSAYAFSGGVEYTREKVINLQWQSSIRMNAYYQTIYSTRKDRKNDTEENIELPNAHLGINHGISYLPNTRTSYNLNYSIDYIHLFNQSDIQKEISGIDGDGISGRINGSMKYYFSPQLSLNLSTSLSYLWQSSDSRTTYNYNEDIGDDFFYLNRFIADPYSRIYSSPSTTYSNTLNNLNFSYQFSLKYLFY